MNLRIIMGMKEVRQKKKKQPRKPQPEYGSIYLKFQKIQSDVQGQKIGKLLQAEGRDYKGAGGNLGCDQLNCGDSFTGV